MDSTATPSVTPIAAELERARPRRTARELARRAKQRRQIQVMIAASYMLDAMILLLYAHAGTVPVFIGPAFAVCGLLSVLFYLVLSETGFTERFKDHYFVVPQLFISVTIMLAFTWMAPEVGVMFLCTLFTVFNFGSLRSTPWQTALAWTVMTAGLAWLFLMTDLPIGLPHHGPIERFATMLVFALTIGRCMFLGIFSSSMRASLYQSGQKLKEAYRRIEELAELDELTGAFNRRCIMRVLDEEIARSQRHGQPCSIALIDLDRF
jgi:predicted signal transduction protein with EAL and GGDEF domain